MRYSGSPLGGLHAAVVDQLARDGAPVYVDRGLGYQFGYTRTAAPSDVGEVWYVTEESELYSLISRAPGAQVLAVSHPLPAAEQAELVALQRKLSDQLTAAGHADDVGYLFSEYVVTALAGIPACPRPTSSGCQALNTVVVRPHLPVLGHRLPVRPDPGLPGRRPGRPVARFRGATAAAVRRVGVDAAGPARR